MTTWNDAEAAPINDLTKTAAQLVANAKNSDADIWVAPSSGGALQYRMNLGVGPSSWVACTETDSSGSLWGLNSWAAFQNILGSVDPNLFFEQLSQAVMHSDANQQTLTGAYDLSMSIFVDAVALLMVR